jgi:phosphoesterase RecJ-like protein
VGKSVITAVDGGVPGDLVFIPGSASVHTTLDGLAVDLVIAVDCGDESRMGEVGRVALHSGAPLINLDHHRTNTMFGAANLVDLATVAAAEGVLDWLDHMGIGLDTISAFCLLTGLVTDTLCFRTDNVSSDTLGKAQRLMAYGASLAEIVQRTVGRKSYAALRLWSLVLPTVRLEERVIWAIITQDMFKQVGYTGWDDAGLVSTLAQTEEAYISAVFKEKPGGGIEIGFRAVPGFDTANVAVVLGGGGHKLASGATVHEPMDTLVPRVVEMLKAEVRRGTPLVE